MGAGASLVGANSPEAEDDASDDISNAEITGLFMKMKEVFNKEYGRIKDNHPDVTENSVFARLFASHFQFEATEEGGVELECSWREDEKSNERSSSLKCSPRAPLKELNPADEASHHRPAQPVDQEDKAESSERSHQMSFRLSICQKVGDKTVFNPKVVQLLGEAAAVGPKAHRILGDQRSTKEIHRQHLAEEEELRHMQQDLAKEANQVLNLERPRTSAGVAASPNRKVLEVFGDEELDHEARKMNVASHPQGKKATALIGESVVSGKAAYKVLGDGMSQEQINQQRTADQREKAEAEVQLKKEIDSLISRPGPDEEQKALKQHETAPLSNKALEMMGDAELEELAKSLVPIGLRSEKLAKLSGESVVAGRKVHQWLGGGMTQEQIESMHLADIKMAQEQEVVMQAEIKELLASGVTPDQIKLAQNEMYGVSEKALKMMGSEELREEAKRLIPKGVKSNKMAKLTGESGMAGKKIRERMGSAMTEDQIRQFIENEKLEKRHQEEKARHDLKEALKVDLSAEDSLEISQDAMVNEKVLKICGDERLEEEAKKHIPKNLKNQKLAKMSGEAQMAGRKVRARLGSGMHEEQCKAAREFYEKEEIEKEKERKRELDEILHATPSNEQLSLAYTPSEKAIKKLGGPDDRVLAASMKKATPPRPRSSNTSLPGFDSGLLVK